MAGALLSMEIPSHESYESFRLRLAERVCPDDPSRVILLERTRRPPNVPSEGFTDDAFSDLLEELHAMAEEKQEAEEEEEAEAEEEEEGKEGSEWDEWDEWQDGDTVEYLVQESEPLSIRLYEGTVPFFTLEDEQECNPFYLIAIHVEREGAGLQDAPLYVYRFLFHLRNGTYHPSCAWKIEEEDGYPYLIFHTHIKYTTLQEMLVGEGKEQESVPSRYLERMRRAIDRKWIRLLRRMGQFRIKERQLQVLHPSEIIPKEKELWKEHYWVAKGKIPRMGWR